MATKFFDILTKYYRTSPEFRKSATAAKNWFRAAAQQIKVTSPDLVQKTFLKLASRARLLTKGDISSIHQGRMILFSYDPKHKKTLPYYDILPLVLPIRIIRDGNASGFLGLNLHYLPPMYRAKLLDALYTFYKDKHMDEKKRLRLNYQVLQSSARYRYFKPCVKRYLFTHIKSKLNIVDPREWDMVMMLPLARWRKASESKVWADSKRKLGIN